MSEQKAKRDLVILVHGIHGYADMQVGFPIIEDWGSTEDFYKKQGYDVKVFNYTPAKKSIENISNDLNIYFNEKAFGEYENVYFVTHSLGGLVTHDYLMKHRPKNFRRAVYMAPPFAGSEMADFYHQHLKDLFKLTSGEVGYQLTRQYRQENPVADPDYELGIITGDKADFIYSLNRKIMNEERDGPDDGLVPVSSATAIKSTDVCIVNENHSSILLSKEARKQSAHFLKEGKFDRDLEGCRFPNP